MKKAILGWIMIIVGVLILWVIFKPKTPPVDNSKTVTVGETVVHVDIADTDALREQGLSGRAALAPDSGMLFVFDAPSVPSFWMKDMNFSLDMVWITASSTVEGVSANLSPASYPEIFTPGSPIQYVLELPAGYFDAHGWKTGMQVVLPPRQESAN